MRSTRARSASRRRYRGDVRVGSTRDEDARVAVRLAAFFACLAPGDLLIIALVDEARLPAILLLIYLASLIAALTVAVWRNARTAGVGREESPTLHTPSSRSS